MRSTLTAVLAVGSSVWAALLSIAVVRLYLSHLGLEAYGVVGFFLSLQAAVQVLDVGLAPAINREVARARALGQDNHGRTVLRTMARVYWSMGIAIATLLALAAPLIAGHWLNSSTLTHSQLARSLVLMGLVIAARWPSTCYQNALIGAGRLDLSSIVTAVMATLTTVVSAVTIIFLSPTLEALFTVQATVALISALVMRHTAWRVLGGAGQAAIDWSVLHKIWRFSLGMGGVTITSIALTQLDKALLSHLLPLPEFGIYMLAVTAAGGFSVLVMPVFSLIFPRFSALVAARDGEGLRDLYFWGARLFGSAYLPAAFALMAYAPDAVLLWTGNATVAAQATLILRLMCLGSAINGLMIFPYALQVAEGFSKVPLAINTGLLCLYAPLVTVMTLHFGAVGSAAAWPILQIVYMAVGVRETHRRSAIGSGLRWVWYAAAVPAAFAVILIVLTYPVLRNLPMGSPIKLMLGVLVAVATTLILNLLSHDLRSRLIMLLKQPKRVHAL